jgi:signal transduction histidine kinase
MAETGSAWRRLAASMRLRITLAAAVVTGIAVVLTGWLLIRSVEDTRVDDVHRRAQDTVADVADFLEAGGEAEAALRMAASDVSISNEYGICSAAFSADGDRRMVCTSQGGTDPGEAQVMPLPPIASGGSDASAPGGAATPGVGAGELAVEPGQVVTREVDTDLYGTVTVSAVGPVDEVQRSVDAVADALWVLLPGLVGVVALASWWLAGRALRPVEAIRAEAESISGDTMHRRLPEPPNGDEIGRLARTMNDMLDRLEDSAQRQRQFVSDASHELRSPVAAIRTDLEVALLHGGDQADWPTVARAVLSEEARLETLLGDLLVLASDDENSALGPRASAVDLARVATDEAARGRRVPVRVDLADGDGGRDDTFVVTGVAARLERALANLVDNAARHAASTVRLSVSRHGDRVRVVVDDDGPGVPAIDRERIFERFARLDGSRARDSGGAGLGLAVVRSIATRHGGYVWADAGPLGGARFTIELPAAHPA